MIPHLTYTTNSGVNLKTRKEGFWGGCSGCYFQCSDVCKTEIGIPSNPSCSDKDYIWVEDTPTMTENIIKYLTSAMKWILS